MHTEGDWRLQKCGVVSYRIITNNKHTMNLDGPWYPSQEQIDEFHANARLIAQAPKLFDELLVSIERGLSLGYSCDDQLELYKEIVGEDYAPWLAKARGE